MDTPHRGDTHTTAREHATQSHGISPSCRQNGAPWAQHDRRARMDADQPLPIGGRVQVRASGATCRGLAWMLMEEQWSLGCTHGNTAGCGATEQIIHNRDTDENLVMNDDLAL